MFGYIGVEKLKCEKNKNTNWAFAHSFIIYKNRNEIDILALYSSINLMISKCNAILFVLLFPTCYCSSKVERRQWICKHSYRIICFCIFIAYILSNIYCIWILCIVFIVLSHWINVSKYWIWKYVSLPVIASFHYFFWLFICVTIFIHFHVSRQQIRIHWIFRLLHCCCPSERLMSRNDMITVISLNAIDYMNIKTEVKVL